MTHTHVITGSFGSGKTTAIKWLMSHKPTSELWVVILNEFTAAGIDALDVAQAAQGDFDVRLVAGGCLCCVGELEFGKQLRDILRTLKPARLLIEPSGAGHAADIIDDLAAYEAQHALSLDSVVCLIDPQDATRLENARDAAWSQIQSADVLLMSKADLAGDSERAAFAAIAGAQYPLKRFVGEYHHGALPAAALAPYSRPASFSLLRTAPRSETSTQELSVGGRSGIETRIAEMGYWAVSWILPRELTFARIVIEPRLTWLLDAYQPWLRRCKGVFRTGPGPSWLVQSVGRGLSGEDSAYRRDSRLEIVLDVAPTTSLLDAWRDMLKDAALTPRINPQRGAPGP